MWRVASVLAVLVAGCTTAPPPALSRGWEQVGYPGLVDTIDRLAGPGAIDCGMHNLVGNALSSAVKRAAHACVRKALEARRPLKYGTRRIPMDSTATEFVVRTADATLWLVAFDMMLDGSVPQQWNDTCASVDVDPQTLIISGEHCQTRSQGILKFE